MLVAINENNMRVYANEAKKVDEYGNKIKYYCPHCHSELVLKQGSIKIPHFSHKSKSDCPFEHEGESYTHELMKNGIKKIIERDVNCLISELEYPIGNRIADYYFEINKNGKIYKIAIECVHKHTNIDDFRSKNIDYANMGIYVMWIFSYNIFEKLGEKRINAILKEAHILGFQTVYAIDEKNTKFYLIHFDKVQRRYDYKPLKATKRCIIDEFHFSNDCLKFYSLSSQYSKYLRKNKLYYNIKVACIDIGQWWKEKVRIPKGNFLDYYEPYYCYDSFDEISYSFILDNDIITIYDNKYGTDCFRGEISNINSVNDIYRIFNSMEFIFCHKLSFSLKYDIINWLFNTEEYDCERFYNYREEESNNLFP